ncbi:MAG: ABC transporter substrate-binding protein, partial [Proteiniphilum sp.]
LESAGLIKPGEPITLTLDMGGRDDMFRRMGEFARYYFRRIGIDLRIELNDWPTLQEKVHNKRVQMYSMGWHSDYPDPENFFQLFYTPNIARGTNNTNYSNEEFDHLYEKSSKMDPGPERTSIYARMTEIINEDCPQLLLTEPVSFVLVHPWVRNYRPHPIAYGTFKYRNIDHSMRSAKGGR